MKNFILKSNTELCVDLKTVLHSDRIAKTGKDYQGVLTRVNEDRFTFIESIPPSTGRRSPQVFRGEFITITRRKDGSYHPNFRPIQISQGFNHVRFAAAVANELMWALEGLVENG